MSVNAIDAAERAIKLEKMYGLRLNSSQKLVFINAMAGQRALTSQKQRLNSIISQDSTETRIINA